MSLVNEETAVRIMVYNIRDLNPDAVKFVPTPNDIKSILLYLKTRSYSTLMYVYGHKFLLEILNVFEEHENYEECANITAQINNHNRILQDSIPTRL